MSLPFAIPGSANAVFDGLDLRAQLALRNELRQLRDDADAVLATLFVFDAASAEVIECIGDRALMPMPLPRVVPPVPSMDAMTCGDQDQHLVVVHLVKIGRRWPTGGLVVVDPAVAPPKLVDLIEHGGARLEAVLVRALSPANRRRH